MATDPAGSDNMDSQEDVCKTAEEESYGEVPVVTQPVCVNRVPAENQWSTQVMDCLLDKRVCVFGSLCPGVLACQMAEKFGECFCLPLLPGSMMMMRTALREKYNIKGSIADDWAVNTFCCPCGLCQMVHEYKLRTAQ